MYEKKNGGDQMINTEKLKQILDGYKTHFPIHWNGEKYKWEAIKHFQDNWNIDADNFGDMFKKATDKTFNLLASGFAYPRGMIQNFAKADDEATRAMFRELYDENVDLTIRVESFQKAAETLRTRYDDGSWRNHYQNTNAISTYLWLRYPDKYYVYKFEFAKNAAIKLNSDVIPKGNGSIDSMIKGFEIFDEMCKVIIDDTEISQMLQNVLTPSCYPDPAMKTVTMDVSFYISRYYQDEKNMEQTVDDWIPKDYNPGISTEQWVELLKNPDVFTANSLQIMKRFKDFGGQATCTQLANKYGGTANFYNTGSTTLAKRVANVTGCEISIRANDKPRYWPILYLGKNATSDDEGSWIWRLRDELSLALDQVDLADVALYEPSDLAEENEHNYWWLTASPKIWSFSEIKIGEEQNYTLYNENGHKRHIYQNFLNVKPGDMVIGYEANPVKKVVAICHITQGNDGKSIYFEKVEGLSTPIEYSALRDCPELKNMEFFAQPNGSLFKLSQDEYDFIMDMIREENPLPQSDITCQKYTKKDFLSKVFMTEERFDVLEKLLRNKKNVILQGAPGVGKTFTAKKLAYAMMGEVDDSRIEMVQFHQNYSYEDFVMGYRPDGADFKLTEGIFYRFCKKAANQPDKEYFFIIDEINRGNLSKIFGELLMLIEKDYRETNTTLAYSGMPFSVPENLFIIGMMNTADRSLAMIDYALRRRFSFFDMEPGFNSEGFIEHQKSISNETFDALIEQVRQLNREIADDKSLGRGFQIGHSYFCEEDVSKCTEEWMRSVVEFDIIPMLNEYWFDEPNKLKRWANNLRGVFDDQG